MRGKPVIGFGAGAAEDQEIEGGEAVVVEAQGSGARGQGPVEIRARPVEDGHEIVADGPEPGAAEIAERLAVIGEDPDEVAAAALHVLMHRQARPRTSAARRLRSSP